MNLVPSWVLLGCLVLASPLLADSEARSVPSSRPWPGLTVLDVALCDRLVWDSGWVEVRGPGPEVTLWVKDVRGFRLPNGFYGLQINGRRVDLGQCWIEYGQHLVNLQILFTLGSVEVDPQLTFQDPPYHEH